MKSIIWSDVDQLEFLYLIAPGLFLELKNDFLSVNPFLETLIDYSQYGVGPNKFCGPTGYLNTMLLITES